LGRRVLKTRCVDNSFSKLGSKVVAVEKTADQIVNSGERIISGMLKHREC
jgi:hypothetical protein